MPPILVPLDFSDCAPKLLDEAIRFARAFQSELLLLHVSDPPRSLPLSAMLHPRGASGAVSVEDLLRADDGARLAPMVREARERGAAAEARVAFGPIAETILEVAARERASMIVMGTHGRTGLYRITLGSIAEDVVRRATVPVVTVRTQHHDGCEASSCGACALGRSEVEETLQAEDDG